MTTFSTQSVAREGVIELAFGEPDPALFPAGDLVAATARALADGGEDALPYGANAGPAGLRRLLAERVSAAEDRATDIDETFITGGNSQALDHVLTLFCSPGDVVLVELPTYSLALGTLRDHPVRVETVPFDEGGLDVGALEAVLDGLERAHTPARLLYTVATFHNPTGISLAADRRRRLVELAAAHDLLIVDDDVYRDLWFDEPSPPSLWSLAADLPGTVLRLGSFAKTLAPGLRVGWLNGTPAQVARLADSGVIDSGGCPSQFAACVVGRYLESGAFDGHVASLRREYAARGEALCAALTEHLPQGCTFDVPRGGFFVWVRLPDGVSATALQAVAERHGVSFVPAARSHANGFDGGLRLAFTLYPPDQLREAARRLGSSLRELRAG